MTSYTNASKNASTYSNTTEWESTILTFLATEDNEIMTSEAEEWIEVENTESPTDYHYDGVSAATYTPSYSEI